MKAAMCMAVGVGLLCSTSILAEVAAEAELGANTLSSLGNDYAPDATAQVEYNQAGPMLVFEFQAAGLRPGKAYQLRYREAVLGEVRADDAGVAEMTTNIEDAAVLAAISADPVCRLDLWQASHRLARSAEFFRFDYER